MPRCYDCLSRDVIVKIIDPLGHEHWFCGEDWTARQRLAEAVTGVHANAISSMEAQAQAT